MRNAAQHTTKVIDTLQEGYHLPLMSPDDNIDEDVQQ